MKASSIFLSVCLAWLAMPVSGQNSLSWTNETIGQFSDKNNWSPNVVPAAADNVYFTVLLGPVNGRSYTVIFKGGEAARSATLGGGVIFDVQVGVANLGETILSTDQLTVTGAGTLMTSDIMHSGLLNIAGGRVTTSHLEFSSAPADVIVTSGGRFASDTTASQLIGTGSALVVGAGSFWTNRGALKINDTTIRSGGQLVAGVATNGTLLVDGTGSMFTTLGNLEVHILTVTNQGRIHNGSANLSFTGLIDGAGSVWTNDDLITMDAGATLTIQNGGQLHAATFHADSSVFVTGTNSQLRLSRDLAVSTTAISDGKVEVNGGGFMQSSSGFIGGNSFGSVTVRDGGSAWAVIGKGLSVGDKSGGALNVIAGGRVSVANNSVFGIGTERTSSGVVNVNGTNSVLDADEVNVGREGTGMLRVQSGGGVSAEKIFIGALAGAKGDAVITGNQSLLKVDEELIVGNQGTGSLSVSAGGKLFTFNTNAVLAISASPGSSGAMTLDGAGTTVNWGLIAVGFRDSGSLQINHGGEMIAQLMTIGAPNSSPSTTTVTGSALRLLFGLEVGGNSQSQGPGVLVVNAGGFVQVDTKLRLFRTGVVQLNGGYVNIGALGLTRPANVLTVSNGGRLAGPGKVLGQKVYNGGIILPGVKDGTLTIDADYEQTSDGELSIDISGPEPDSGYDVLNVTGDVTLAGKLTLNFINGFAPKAGQTFDFLKFGTNIVGNFNQIEVTGLGAGFQYEVKQSGAGTFSLVALNDGIATSPPLLSIDRVGVDLLVSWPANVQGFVLQSSTDLGSSNWIDLITTANQLSIQTTNAMKFFRLIKR